MAQLLSVRSNQDFSVNYETKKLVPQTEIIILVEKPTYKVKKDNIVRDTQVQELRFKCGSKGLLHLIGMLEGAHKSMVLYEKMAGNLNNILSDVNNEDEKI